MRANEYNGRCPKCGGAMGPFSKLCRACFKARAAERRAAIDALRAPDKPLPQAADNPCADVRGCYLEEQRGLPACKPHRCSLRGIDLHPDHPEWRYIIKTCAEQGYPIVTARGELQ